MRKGSSAARAAKNETASNSRKMERFADVAGIVIIRRIWSLQKSADIPHPQQIPNSIAAQRLNNRAFIVGRFFNPPQTKYPSFEWPRNPRANFSLFSIFLDQSAVNIHFQLNVQTASS